MLQRVAACCSVLQSVAVHTTQDASDSAEREECLDIFMCVAVCCSVMQCVAACCSAHNHRTHVIVRREKSILTYSYVLQRDAVCCSAHITNYSE